MLNNDFNVAFGRTLIPFLKLALILAFITSFSASVRLFSDLDAFSYSFVVVATSTSFLFLAPIAMIMSSMFDLSAQFPRQLSLKIQQIPEKRTRRICEANLKSCAVICVQVGNFYHMEAQAKLTLMEHLVNGVVFIMVNLI